MNGGRLELGRSVTATEAIAKHIEGFENSHPWA